MYNSNKLNGKIKFEVLFSLFFKSNNALTSNIYIIVPFKRNPSQKFHRSVNFAYKKNKTTTKKPQ